MAAQGTDREKVDQATFFDLIATAMSENSLCSFNNNTEPTTLKNPSVSRADTRQSSQQGANQNWPKKQEGCGRLVIGSTYM